MDNLYAVLEHANHDLVYLDRLLATIAVNKVEAQCQQRGQPAIYRKEFDELGLIRRYSIDSRYRGRVPIPETEFSAQEHDAFLARIEQDPEFCKKLEVMLVSCKSEAKFVTLCPEALEEGPVIERVIGDDGLPVVYSLSDGARRRMLVINP